MQAVVTVPVQTEALVGVVYCKDRVREPWPRFEGRETKKTYEASADAEIN